MRGKYDGAVFELFVELYERLPLAFVIGAKTLVVHGGLSNPTLYPNPKPSPSPSPNPNPNPSPQT